MITLLFGVVCNYPCKNPNDFLNYLYNTLKKLSKESEEIALSGDFNIDLFMLDKITFVEDFLNIMFCIYYQPVILQPTRYTDKNRSSLIDNIFVNSLDLKATSGNFIAKVSGHMPNFITLERKIHITKKSNILKRNFKNFKESDYIKDIKDNFDFVDDGCQNIDSKYDLFQQNVLDIIEKHAPLQRSSKKGESSS